MFSFPAPTVRYVVVAVILSVIVVVVCVCFVKFHCYPKMAALFVLTFFRISLSFSLSGFLFVLTRNVIHASVFVVVVLIVICIDGVYFILCCWACV